MGEPATDIYVPEEGKVAIRDPDGSVWKIPQGQLPAAQQEGARPATEAEYFGAQAGRPGEVASGVVGAARGATFGLSDPIYVEGARALGGDDEAEDVRHTLKLLKQANPNATIAGEIGGAVAPAFFGAPPAGAAESLGGSALTRFGARAAAAAPRAIGEGVGIGLGSQLSEDTIENHKMSGEAYLTAGLKGGAIGLFLGAGGAGVLGAAGDKLSALAGRGERGALQAEERGGLRLVEDAQPYRTAGARAEETATEAGAGRGILGKAEDLRDQLTYKATGANRTDVKQLGKTAEEQSARIGSMADTLRNQTFEGRPLVEATIGEKEINRRIVGKANEVGKELGAMRAKLDTTAERPSLTAIRDRFEAELAPELATHLGGEELANAGRAKLAEAMKIAKGDAPTFEQLYTFRRDLEKLSKYDKVPTPASEMFSALRNMAEDEFTTAGERAAKSIGDTFADNYRLQKSLYRDLATARDASNRAVGRGTGNNWFSLTDATVAGGAIASGNPLALAAVGANIVRRKYGNQIAAHVLDTATHMESVQRAATKLDQLINDGTKAFVSGSKLASRPMKSVTTEEIRALREATRSPEAVTARIAEQLGDMPKYAPKTAQEIATTGGRMAAWFQQSLPKEAAPMAPQFGKPKDVPISDTDRLKAAAIIETANDGSIVVDRLRDGRLTDDHVATLRFTQPETYAKIRTYLAQHATDLAKDMTVQQLSRLGMLFGEPLQEVDLPENRRAFQASFSQGNQAPGQGGAGGNTGMAALRAKPVPGGGPGATQTQRLEAGTS